MDSAVWAQAGEVPLMGAEAAWRGWGQVRRGFRGFLPPPCHCLPSPFRLAVPVARACQGPWEELLHHVCGPGHLSELPWRRRRHCPHNWCVGRGLCRGGGREVSPPT